MKKVLLILVLMSFITPNLDAQKSNKKELEQQLKRAAQLLDGTAERVSPVVFLVDDAMATSYMEGSLGLTPEKYAADLAKANRYLEEICGCTARTPLGGKGVL